MDEEVEQRLAELPAWEAALADNGHITKDGDAEDVFVPINEAMSTSDAPLLFPKAVSNTLREAAAPELLVTPLLETVRVNARAMEFPAVNAIQANEIPEGHEYPDQQLAFARQIEGRASKKGVKVSFTEEVIRDSQWDVMGLHIRAAGRAMARLKEQIALDRFFAASTAVNTNTWNSDGSVNTAQTSGRDIDGALNGTLTWDDVVDQAAQLMFDGHVPTDFIAHPMAWAVFQRDPVFRSMAGNPNVDSRLSQRMDNTGLGESYNAGAPLGLNFIISPYVNFSASAGTNGDGPPISDVFLIDRNEVGTLMVRDEMSTDEWDEVGRDVRQLKMKERYDIVVLGDGEGLTVNQNVAVDKSYEVQVTNEMGSS